jgi:hypothetical protein
MISEAETKWHRSTALTLVVALVGSFALTSGFADSVGASAQSHALTVSPSSTPAFNADAPDPDVVLNAGTYYAFTTGTALGNHIQALVDTSGNPASGYGSYTGQSYGSSALPTTPSWETENTQTSPGVFYWGGQWLMYYDASTDGYQTGTGHDCLSVATASQLTPSNPVFVDNSSAPLLCQAQLGGSIDPSPFIDPATGQAYLVWKSNDGGSSQPAEIWSAELDSSGLGFASAPVELMTNDTVDYPWETTVEAPDLVDSWGTYYLLFSGGQYDSSSYAEGYAICNGPLGPCYQPQAGPILSSYGSVVGPGGGSLFEDAAGSWWIDYAAWTAGCTSYSCSGSRKLYVAPISLPSAADEAFLHSAYEDLLGRAPDSEGITYWSAQLANGVSRGSVAATILASTEYRTDLISDYYETYLGRASDSGGLTYWVAQRNGGARDESVLASILGSVEFYADSGSTAGGFVTALYTKLLSRSPDSGGLTYWEDELFSGASRSAIAVAFLASNEYRSDFVKAQYTELLGRAADSGGLTYWVAQLAGGASNESVIAGIVGSSEFYMDATA